MAQASDIPVIDVEPLVRSATGMDAAARSIRKACCESGFFYIVGHGIDLELQARLEEVSRHFFSLDVAGKLALRMELGGKAWRGYFPVGAELTSGRPDQKEGIYFGAELPDHHPKVAAGVPLHGRNLFPAVAGFRDTVLDYMQRLTELGHALMQGVALSLGLDVDYFRSQLTADPLILFRIFHYPPQHDDGQGGKDWGVGEHTDYGLLTILKQDNSGGLQVKSGSRWIDATPIPDAFVCNIGDMLDRMTGGLYRSTPHRVRNAGTQGRLSFPFFFDPGFDATVAPVPTVDAQASRANDRWDDENVHEFEGTYGDYILNKVSRVFPQLSRDAL